MRPIESHEPPHVDRADWSVNPIDAFVFAKLQEQGLSPSLPAPKNELLRRVTFDLTGLPPTPEEIDAFLTDDSPAAYEKVVDRLLASPRYGERWGRHWLDVVRYGESNGYEQNHLRPTAWHYRDYVIRAFNEDKPYDRFITEQLAGDLVGKGDPLIEPATGFLVAGVHDTVGIANVEGSLQQRERSGRHRFYNRRGLHGPDRRLRPLPRSQVRPDRPARLLPPLGGLRRRSSSGTAIARRRDRRSNFAKSPRSNRKSRK